MVVKSECQYKILMHKMVVKIIFTIIGYQNIKNQYDFVTL